MWKSNSRRGFNFEKKFQVLETSIFQNLHKESFGASLPDTLNGTNIHNYYLTTEIPKRYLKNSPQPETSFLYLPESVKTTKCQKIESQSIYLIKTARNAAFERFKIRRNFFGDGFILTTNGSPVNLNLVTTIWPQWGQPFEIQCILKLK